MVYESMSIHLGAILWHLKIGLLMCWFGIGLIPLGIGLLQILKSAFRGGARWDAFYGTDWKAAQALRRQEAMQL